MRIRISAVIVYPKSMDFCSFLNNWYKKTSSVVLRKSKHCNLITKTWQDKAKRIPFTMHTCIVIRTSSKPMSFGMTSFVHTTNENPLNCVIVPIKFSIFVLKIYWPLVTPKWWRRRRRSKRRELVDVEEIESCEGHSQKQKIGLMSWTVTNRRPDIIKWFLCLFLSTWMMTLYHSIVLISPYPMIWK